jgi:hypothetical protein
MGLVARVCSLLAINVWVIFSLFLLEFSLNLPRLWCGDLFLGCRLARWPDLSL